MQILQKMIKTNMDIVGKWTLNNWLLSVKTTSHNYEGI